MPFPIEVKGQETISLSIRSWTVSHDWNYCKQVVAGAWYATPESFRFSDGIASNDQIRALVEGALETGNVTSGVADIESGSKICGGLRRGYM